MSSDHLILCCPLLLLPSIFPSIRDFSNELAVRIRWPKYWSFGFSISPSNEYSRLISFKIDWFDLLAVEGTLKMVEWNHQFNGHKLMQTLGDDEGQGSLACCMQAIELQSLTRLGSWTTRTCQVTSTFLKYQKHSESVIFTSTFFSFGIWRAEKI